MTEAPESEYAIYAGYRTANGAPEATQVQEAIDRTLRDMGVEAVGVLVVVVPPAESSGGKTGLDTPTSLLFEGVATQSSGRAKAGLHAQGLRTARAILAVGAVDVHGGFGPKVLSALRQNLNRQCPDLVWHENERPRAPYIASFCPSLSDVPVQVLLPQGRLNIPYSVGRRLPPFTVADVLKRDPKIMEILGDEAEDTVAKAVVFAAEFAFAKQGKGARP